MILEDENQLLFFSNGMIVNLMSNGAISFDSSGQVRKYYQFSIRIDNIYSKNNCYTTFEFNFSF